MIRFVLFLFPIFLSAQTLHLEHAVTPDQITWGLMGRKELKEDHGMLFHFRQTEKRSFWMFNCYIDLALAYLDENGKILSLHELKSHPDKIVPIQSVQQLRRLRSSHPAIIFFQNRSVASPYPSRYALEMPAGWFTRHDVNIGDRVVWKNYESKAHIDGE